MKLRESEEEEELEEETEDSEDDAEGSEAGADTDNVGDPSVEINVEELIRVRAAELGSGAGRARGETAARRAHGAKARQARPRGLRGLRDLAPALGGLEPSHLKSRDCVARLPSREL